MVMKSDWKTVDMPVEREQFCLKRNLTGEDIAMLREGYLPKDMEDRWFMYFENDNLYIHRSWTGFCIYIMSFPAINGEFNVIVNRNREQYKETNTERDKVNLNILINGMIKKQTEMRR